MCCRSESTARPPRWADTWEVTADQKQITLHLRKAVRFHTGRELTSDDIKANVLRVRDPSVRAAQLAPQSAWWTSIDTPDPCTITLSSDAPRPAMFDFFEYLNIVDPVTAQGPDAATSAVGTGPFTFVEWVQGDHLMLRRNPTYWQSGLPKLDQVLIGFGRDPQAMVTSLEASTTDMVINAPLSDAARLRTNPAYQFVSSTTAGTFVEFIVNTRAPGLDNAQVRQALNHALNRRRMVDSVRYGIGQAQDLPWAPSSPASDLAKNTVYGFDLDKARGLLQQAGGTAITLDLVYAAGGDAAGYAQIFQADLAQIGITANLKLGEG
ncbi:MAG: ABC transporter substrate-binding protein, partial [Chloroflexi bacterium]|nr:ABC transporter substrate-binding protein [Chloroflexota bacterium]